MLKKKRVITYLWPIGFGAALLLLPLLRDLHLESALLISIIFCFWGGISASSKSSRSDLETIAGLILKVILIAVPLVIHGLIANCLTWAGAGFWALLPLPSILFGVAIGRFYRVLKFPIPRFLSVITLLIIGVGILAFEFFTLPQVYYFNHVWGSWPGPIYDEEVRITSSLLWFRLTTILWVIFLWCLPNISTSKTNLSFVVLAGSLIVTSLFIQPQLGISTPRSHLKSELNELIKTEHFHLYFDTSNFDEQERDYWAARHEFHFQQVINVLEIDWPENQIIESFIYDNAWRKKELVGAKFTSYVPVWLKQDQLHIAKEHLDRVLKHELVHVISKQFGNDLINASWSIGLIEGVAEAIAKDASNVSTLDQIIAAEDPLPTTTEMAQSLTISGFYASASAISYTTAGSFVGYLLDNYPIDNFKAAYPNSDFEEAYLLPFDTLVTRWKNQLPVTEVDSMDAQVSRQIFSQQSLFQMNCPRKIHPILQGLDDLRYHESLSDSVNALQTINDLFADYPEMPLIKQLWASYQLRNHEEIEVINNVYESDSTMALQLMRADAFFMNGTYSSSTDILEHFRSDSSFVASSNALDSFLVRSDSTNWTTFVQARYQNILVDLTTFQNSPEPLQWLLIDRAIVLNQISILVEYADFMVSQSPTSEWFETQESLINMLVYYGEFELAQVWIDHLSSLELRDRFIERVHEQQEWLDFSRAYQQ